MHKVIEFPRLLVLRRVVFSLFFVQEPQRLAVSSKMDFRSMMNQSSMGGGPGAGGLRGDTPMNDNAEMIYISSLALLKVRLRFFAAASWTSC